MFKKVWPGIDSKLKQYAVYMLCSKCKRRISFVKMCHKSNFVEVLMSMKI